MSWLAAFQSMFMRDIRIAIRNRAELTQPLIFFVVIVSLFPLAISPEKDLLRVIGPGVIWIAALLSVLMSLQQLFRADFQDGAMEQILLSSCPGSILILARVFAQWCITGLPLVLVSPLLGMLLHLDTAVIQVLFLSLLLGVPYLNMIGAIAVALTIGIRQAGVLLSLLVLPLYVPVLIFGSDAVSSAGNQLPYTGQLLWLAALLVIATTLSPMVITAALRVACSYR